MKKRHQLAPVHDMLEHFNRYDAVELPLRIEHVRVCRGHAKILQCAHRGLPLDIFALRLRIRHRCNLRIWKLPRHPQRQRAPAAAKFEDRLSTGNVSVRDGLAQRFFLSLLQRGFRLLVIAAGIFAARTEHAGEECRR